MEGKKHEQLTFASLALALANDYDRLFVIDTADDSYAEYTASGSEKELEKVSEGKDFYAAVPPNCREQVWEEDQENFLAAFRKENVNRALADGKSFTLTYRLKIDGKPRYTFLKTIMWRGNSIIIGVQDIDEQMRRELAAEEEVRIYSEIAMSLASMFSVIYHIDIKTGYYREYSANKIFKELGYRKEGDNFFERIHLLAPSFVYPEDLPLFLHETKKETLIENLKKEPTVSFEYRQFQTGDSVYMKLTAFHLNSDEDSLVVGIRNINARKQRDIERETYAHIAGALASRYEVIYYINDDRSYTLYSASEEYAQLGTTKKGDNFYKDAFEDTKKYTHPDDAEAVLAVLDEKHLSENLSKNGFLSINYRQMLDGRYQYLNMFIVHPKKDRHHIILAVLNTDSQMRKKISIETENRTFSNISMALAQRYEVIYHVNTDTGEYTEYSASEKYTKLKVGMTGSDFFGDTQRNMKRDIYPEDLPMMAAAMQKENLLKSLSANGKTVINYRLILDGKPQYVSLYAVRPKEDSKHIIVAVANIDAAKRMEIAYQNAVDMANRDSLTGLKNKRAYAQTEMDVDERIDSGELFDFSVVICDINGLKQVNDTQGHKAGDDFIKHAASILTNTFVNSTVFRIGGDEFAVPLCGRDNINRSELMKKLHEKLAVAKYNGIPVLAVGMSEFEPGRDMRVQDVFERADNLMYLDKQLCKGEKQMPGSAGTNM